MRLFSSIIMFVIGALLLVSSFTVANAFTHGKSGAQTEVETSMAGQEDAPVVNRTLTTSRGTVKFHMKMPFADAEGLALRPRINRLRSTTMRSNAVLRDSVETDVSSEDLIDVSFLPKTDRRSWRTSTSPRPISGKSLEEDDVGLRSAPVVNRNPLSANRFNRIRTTTVPSAVESGSLKQDDDDTFLMSLKPAVSRLRKTNLSAGSRFNHFRTTAARDLVSKDSVETNDFSLEDLIVVAKTAPMVNRALTAPRSRSRIEMKTSIGAISPSTSTLAPTTLVDSTEKTDISTEDSEKTTLVVPATTLMVTESETATTEELGTTTIPMILVSLQSDEQDDVFIIDKTTVTPAPTSDFVDSTFTMVQLTTQSDEQEDFERIKKLAVALDGTQLASQFNNVAMTTLLSHESDEHDDWTVSMPTSTMAPAITRSPLVSKGRGRFQSLTPNNQMTRNRLSHVRLHSIKSSVSRDSDDQEGGMVKQMQAMTSRVPASANRFSRVRTTTVPPPVFKDSVERNDVSLEDLVFAVPKSRRPLMGSRFSRFRTATATSAAATVEQEDVASKSESPKIKSRFSRVRSTTARVPVAVDSVKEDSLIAANEFSRMNKASKVSVQSTASNGQRVMPNGNPLATRGRGSRGRTTAAATLISKHSMEDFSLEDTLKELVKTGFEQMSIQQPAIIPVTVKVAVPLSHSDERDDGVDVLATAVTLVGGVTHEDVSDEAPTTTTLDPVSRESEEKGSIALVLVDETVVPIQPTEVSLHMFDLPDISDEALHLTTVNPVSKESEELPLTLTK